MEDNKCCTPNPAPLAEDPDKGKFRAGYGIVDITPSEPVPMAGYGVSEKRLSTRILDDLYTTCIAITDENGGTLLLYTVDILNCFNQLIDQMRTEVSKAFGLPYEHVLVNATHSHSSVDATNPLPSAQRWNEFFIKCCLEAARLAMEDRHPAKMLWTTVDLTGYNFVRHYYTDLGEGISVNHQRYALGKRERHTTTANPIMYVLKLVREGAKDIMMANWRAHNVMTSMGGRKKTDISADWTGQVRVNIEADLGVHFAYFQGEAGNIVTSTALPEEVEHHPPMDYKEYARELSSLMEKQLDDGWEEVKPGPIRVVQDTLTSKTNKVELEYAEEAQRIIDVWKATGSNEEAMKMETSHHIQSPYHAAYLVARPKWNDTGTFEFYVCSIGDFAFTMAPFETFDTNGDYVHENSPTKYTMVMGYSNHSHSYLPSAQAFDYGCFEVDMCWMSRGTGEALATKYVEILNRLYGKD